MKPWTTTLDRENFQFLDRMKDEGHTKASIARRALFLAEKQVQEEGVDALPPDDPAASVDDPAPSMDSPGGGDEDDASVDGDSSGDRRRAPSPADVGSVGDEKAHGGAPDGSGAPSEEGDSDEQGGFLSDYF